ncbi:MAG: hypothetical protein MUC50_06440 [Myxococcota bacterium]|jgi:hypothetical protein|nr:hypothetical protein [Myxococcota bacterium]
MTRPRTALLFAMWLLLGWTLDMGCSSFAPLEPAPVRQVTSALLGRASESLGQELMMAIAALCNTKGQSIRLGTGEGAFVHRCINAERFLEVQPWLVDLQVRNDAVELIALSATVPEGESTSTALVAALCSQVESQCNERQQQDSAKLLFSGCADSFAVAALLTQKLSTPQTMVTVVLASQQYALDTFLESRGQR